jgi:hypothetical protein
MKQLYTVLAALLLFSGLAAQPAGWSHVQNFTVQNNTATQVTDYQLQLTINTQALIAANEMQANGADLRFGKECNGATQYNYWIQSGLNTTTTIVWVKIDTLPASGSMNLFMYYGNAAATGVSGIPGVFIGPHSSTDSTANTQLSGSANAQRGHRFAPTEDILVTAFGKNEPSSNPRYITLFDYNTQAILSQQQVAGPSAQWSYGNLASPLWLTQNTQYLLEIFFPAGDDAYYFGASPTMGQHIQYLDMRYCNGCTQNTFPTNALGGMLYGYVDMWYWTKQNIATAPTVTTAGPLNSSVTLASAICVGDSVTGSVNASGGAAPYSYSWAPVTGVAYPFNATTQISPPASQTYTVTVTDGCGTISTTTVGITVNPLPVVTANVSDDSLCIGESFTPAGGGASSYAWSAGLNDNTPFTPNTTDTYTVTGTDMNGCSATASVTVEVFALPTVTAATSDDSVCLGSTFIPMGSGASTYTWSGGMTDNVPFAPTVTDTYTVTGTDVNGCTDTASVSVEILALPPVTASVTLAEVCSGTSVTFTGSGALSYTWDNGVTDNVSFTPSSTTMYHVTGTDQYGCQNMDSVQVIVNSNPVLAVAGDTVCAGDCIQFNATATGGSPAYDYLWIPSIGLNDPTIPNPMACNQTTTCYTVTVTDANGCDDVTTVCGVVNQLPVASANGPSTTCVTDGAYTLSGSPAGGTFSGPGVTGNTFSPAAAGNGTHQVVYTYTDPAGCAAMDTLSIVVSPCVGIAEHNAVGAEVFPNPFSNTLQINLTGEENHVRMYNGLGQVVFEQVMNKGRNEINTSALDAGIYFLEIVSGSQSATIKVVKE